MKIGFFGDSWVAGCELTGPGEGPSPELAFPSMFKKTCNFGKSGSSIDGLVDVLLDNLDITHAIFCLTSAHRRKTIDTEHGTQDGFLPNILSKEKQQAQLTLDDPLHNDDLVAKYCSLLYFICNEHNIVPYFVNLFSGHALHSKVWKCIPDKCWIISPYKSLVSELFDTTNFFPEYGTDGDYGLWITLSNNPDVKQYIHPCEGHPNINGHRVIANFLKEKVPCLK